MEYKNLRFYFSLLLLLLAGAGVNAQTDRMVRAQKAAAGFFERKTSPSKMMSTGAAMKKAPAVMWSSAALRKADGVRTAADGDATFFMFANPNGEGFALVSGDDVKNPVIGYSLDGNPASLSDMPDNMREYLLGIDEQIRSQRNRARGAAYAAGPTFGTAIGNVMVQLQTASWGQHDPFNRDCFNPQGQKSLTGCVPTAFAIVMRYHEWPLSGNGMVNNNGAWGTSQRDISGNVYDWKLMPLKYAAGEYSDAEAEQVSQLMYDVGCAALVDYGTRVTGGNPSSSMLAAMQSHFGYKNGVFAKRDLGYYSDEQWNAALRSDLDAGRPVPYAATRVGSSAAPDAKHMFVVDGYTDNGYYHFNWGWNGSCNGYYTLADMTPDNNGSYRMNHIAVFNFTPDIKDAFTISVSSQGNGNAFIGSAMTTTSRLAAQGSALELHAKAAAGYAFANWTLNGMVVSESENFVVTVEGDAHYTANFVQSGAAAGDWYYVKFKNYDKYLTAAGIAQGLTAADKNAAYGAAQLWEFIDKNGRFEIRNQNNIYLCIKSAVTRGQESAEVYLDYAPTEKKFKKERWNNNGGGERVFFYGEINDFPLSILPDGRVAFVKSNSDDNINIELVKAESSPVVPPVVVKHKVTLSGNGGTRVTMSADGMPIASGDEVKAGADVTLSFAIQNNEQAEVSAGTGAAVLVNGTSYVVRNIQADTDIVVNISRKPEPKVNISVKSADAALGSVYIGDVVTASSVTVNKGDRVTIHASAMKDCSFTGWTSNVKAMTVTDKDYSFTAENDVVFTANFVKNAAKPQGDWYYVKFKNFDRYLTAESAGGGITADVKKGVNNPSQLWEFVKKAGEYEIRNQNNIYLCISSKVRYGEETADVYLDNVPSVKKFRKEKWNNNGGGERIFYYGDVHDFPLSILPDNRVAFVMSNSDGNINVVLEKAEGGADVPVVVKHKVTLSGNAGTSVRMSVDGKVIASGDEVPEGADVMLSFMLKDNQEALVAVDGNDAVKVSGTSYVVRNIRKATDICVTIRTKVVISVRSADAALGSAFIGDDRGSSTLTVIKGDSVSVHAVTAGDALFVGWTDASGQMACAEKDYTFTAVNDMVLTAQFKKPEVKKYPVTLNTASATKVVMFVNGKVFGGGNVEAGSDIELRFAMDVHERALVSVNGGETAVVTDSSFFVKNVQQAVNIDVEFEKDEYVSISVISGANGTAYIDAEQVMVTVKRGSSVMLHAVADDGYLFDNWSLNGVPVSSDADYSVRADVNAEYTANFKMKTEQVKKVFYAIRFCERGGLLTAGASVTAAPESAASADDQLWLFIPSVADADKYYIKSKSGRFLKLARRRGDAVMTTTDVNDADLFYYMPTKDYDRWQSPAHAGSYLLVKDHRQRYCIEESAENPGKVIGYNQPWEYTELQFEPHEVVVSDVRGDMNNNVASGITVLRVDPNDVVYDINGNRVKTLVRGEVYIRNGVKFVAR